ncbi:hypothetical protein XENOCAPTIV_016880, partial [Xenoophorus captivus]
QERRTRKQTVSFAGPHAQSEVENSAKDEDNCIDRFMSNISQDATVAVPPEEVHAICQRHIVHSGSQSQSESPSLGLFECVAMDANVILPEYSHIDSLPRSCTLPRMSQNDWDLEQKKDPSISQVKSLLERGKKPPPRLRQHEDREVQLILGL